MTDPIDKGPAPASPLPWTRGPSGESLSLDGGHSGNPMGWNDAERNALDVILHRVNGWDALVERCEATERERDELRTQSNGHYREAVRLAGEVGRLRAWVNDIQAGCFISCVYCGHRYGPDPGTPVAMADVLRAHVERCPDHPMSQLRECLDALVRAVSAMVVLPPSNDEEAGRAGRLLKALGDATAHLGLGPDGEPKDPCLWDEHGTPRQPHRPCPKCGDSDEVGSHSDRAWCHRCGWSGSLAAMHAETKETAP